MATQTAVQKESTQSKQMMIFILVMSLSGLADLVAEIMPQLELGPLEISISTFWFVPLTLAILFNNWWAALAVPIGEIVFSDLLLGEFGGLGEFQEVILVSVALFIAGWLVRDPRNRRQLIIAGLVAYAISELPAAFIDMITVWVGVEEFEAVEGLPESVFALEMIDFLIEYVVTGILVGLLPMLWLLPRLHGKIEPLMGIKPRTEADRNATDTPNRMVVYGVVGFVAALLITLVAASGFNIVEWEAEFLDSIGAWFIWVAIVITGLVAAAILYIRSNQAKK
ncbi:MAG: hypothetical protein V9G20_16380 [Candidatus Promineifilaceae bacterium]